MDVGNIKISRYLTENSVEITNESYFVMHNYSCFLCGNYVLNRLFVNSYIRIEDEMMSSLLINSIK